MKKITVVTGTRADYGLLYWPVKSLVENGYEVELVATGTHFSKKHGYTVDQIIKDQMPLKCSIDLNIDEMKDGDSPDGISKLLGLFITEFSKHVTQAKPDLLLILGDRIEILGAAQVAMIHNIPIAHLHGGEITEGAIDDSIRHALTKLSHIHFASSVEARNRIIQMGESPQMVFPVGAPGLDNIKRLNLMTREELCNDTNFNFKFNKKNILMTYHPVTISKEKTNQECKAFFNAIENLDNDTNVFITLSNADTYSSIIFPFIDKLTKQKPDNAFIFKSLGQLRYLSLARQMDLVIGNSSSGIIEIPFLAVPVVDIGIRQKGRSSSGHVIHVENVTEESVTQAILTALSPEFKNTNREPSDLYGDGNSSMKMITIINGINFNNLIPKKFYDLGKMK